jgi:hypothetical protein
MSRTSGPLNGGVVVKRDVNAPVIKKELPAREIPLNGGKLASAESASIQTADVAGGNGATAAAPQRFVCPFCGSVNAKADEPCPRCSMENTPVTRQATRARIGPWYVLQTRNPAAPGMKFATLISLIRKGQVTSRSIVRGPSTHQLWKFASKVKGISREFGVCHACGQEIEKTATSCPQCFRSQEPPTHPDWLLELSEQRHAELRQVQEAAQPKPVFREVASAAPVAAVQPTASATPDIAVVQSIATPAPVEQTAAVTTPMPAVVEQVAVPIEPSKAEEPVAAGKPEMSTAIVSDIGLATEVAEPSLASLAAAPTVVATTSDAAVTTPSTTLEGLIAAGNDAVRSEETTPAEEASRSAVSRPILTPQQLAAAFRLDYQAGKTDRAASPAAPAPTPANRPRPQIAVKTQKPSKPLKVRSVIATGLGVAAVAAGGVLTLSPTIRQPFIGWIQRTFPSVAIGNPMDMPRPAGSFQARPPASSNVQTATAQSGQKPPATANPTAVGTTGAGRSTDPGTTAPPAPSSSKTNVTPPAPVGHKPDPQPATPTPSNNSKPADPPSTEAKHVGSAAPTSLSDSSPVDRAMPRLNEPLIDAARRMYTNGIDAEQAHDYKSALHWYYGIAALPPEFHQSDLDGRIKDAKERLQAEQPSKSAAAQ